MLDVLFFTMLHPEDPAKLDNEVYEHMGFNWSILVAQKKIRFINANGVLRVKVSYFSQFTSQRNVLIHAPIWFRNFDVAFCLGASSIQHGTCGKLLFSENVYSWFALTSEISKTHHVVWFLKSPRFHRLTAFLRSRFLSISCNPISSWFSHVVVLDIIIMVVTVGGGSILKHIVHMKWLASSLVL